MTASTSELRGDYTRAAADYSVEQDWSAYTDDEHALFRRLYAITMLARLYGYTIEFGLMNADAGVRACGAGPLSSGGELACCVDDPKPRRRAFELERNLRTDYRIDRYRDCYFVIDSFAQLLRETAPDFAPVYARPSKLPALDPQAT